MLQIIVFTDPTPTKKQSHLVATIDQYYTVFVDSKHGYDLPYLQSRFSKNHRFFFVCEFVSMCTADELSVVAPDFVVVFSEEVSLQEKDWICVERYLESLFFPNTISDEVATAAKTLLLEKQRSEPLVKSEFSDSEQKEDPYNLTCHHIEDRNIMLVQVDKPYCDLPYTVVIRNYSEKGFLSFFTDLFICYSWGVCRKDYAFLERLWEYWEMAGSYDLNSMLLEATKRCFPQEGVQPEAEPEVYRRDIPHVLSLFDKKENQGCQSLHKDHWNEERVRKRKRDDLLID